MRLNLQNTNISVRTIEVKKTVKKRVMKGTNIIKNVLNLIFNHNLN